MNTPAPLDAKLAEERVLGWQTKLHRWAAQDGQCRFGDLFNLVCDPATLLVAWERVKRNRGSRTAGIDGQTRRVVEQMGVEGVLAGLRAELKDGTYRPLPARERLIPKRSGKLRTLGISTVRDRIVQTAAKLVLEPIFEADFCPTSYGFRPGRRAQDAIEQVRFFINAPRSYEWVIEGDVEDCFGSIHQGLLMEQVRRRVTDKRVLALIRLSLAAGIMREQGSLAATPSGTPQGSGATAPTQKATLVVVVSVRGGDGVSDRDLFVIAADQDFADDEPQDPLLVVEGQLVEAVAEAGEEALQGVGELEVGLGVVQVRIERVELGLERALALAEGGHPGAQLLERDQLFLVCLDQPFDRAGGAGEVALERFAAAGSGVLGP